jgi:hypothetical protein
VGDEDAVFLSVAERTIGDAIETVEHVIESLTWLGTEPNPVPTISGRSWLIAPCCAAS